MAVNTKIYLPRIWNFVAQIGEKVGLEVGLFRAIDGHWVQLTPERGELKLSTDLFPNYVGAYMEGMPKAGPFRIARIGADHTRNDYITSFYITPFPGCCAYAISTAAGVHSSYRHRGVHKLALQVRIAIAGFTGYSGLVCTDKATNEYSVRTLRGAGFKELYETKNTRTGNKVVLYLKDIE